MGRVLTKETTGTYGPEVQGLGGAWSSTSDLGHGRILRLSSFASIHIAHLRCPPGPSASAGQPRASASSLLRGSIAEARGSASYCTSSTKQA